MKINIKDVQALREFTGAGIVDCRNALSESNGDIELAKDLLRKKGINVAQKKIDRDANEGLIGIKCDHEKCVILEINSETDFVANNEFFQDFCQNVLDLILQNPFVSDIDALMQLECSWSQNISLHDVLINVIGVIRENIKIKKFKIISKQENQTLSYYLHNKVGSNFGKLGVVLLSNKINNVKNSIEDIEKKVCMHIASNDPLSINKNQLDPALIEKEKKFLLDEMKYSKKPQEIIDKIIDGKINKLYEKCVLLEQDFFLDEQIKIKDMNVDIVEFVRFKIN